MKPTQFVVLHTPGPAWQAGLPATAEDTLRAFAADDPAVRSGLLVFEVRPWLAGLQR